VTDNYMWSTYDTLKKIDDRWSVITYIGRIEDYTYHIYGKRYRKWQNLVDTTTGYIINVTPLSQVKPFIKLFNEMGFTAEIVEGKYTNALYDKKAVTQYYITVCEYTSSCGKYHIRSWRKYTGK